MTHSTTHTIRMASHGWRCTCGVQCKGTDVRAVEQDASDHAHDNHGTIELRPTR